MPSIRPHHVPESTASLGRRRSGLTLLETVAAVVLLSLLAAAVLGALSNVVAQQTRQQRRVQAMELANRLMLQYLDDPNLLPSRSLPVAYGKERFRWDAAETPTRLVPALAEVAAEREQRSALIVNRIKVVTLRVWLSEESGGSMGPDDSVPSATLTRLVDPVAALYRNPDTMAAILADDKRKREILAQFTDTAAGGLVNRPTNAGGPRPTTAGSPTTGKGSTAKGSTSKGTTGKGTTGKGTPPGRGRSRDGAAPQSTGGGGGGGGK
jgi:hypothetical protein